MRNRWYGDNRDLMKWSVLIHLATRYNAKRILQIAYFREDDIEHVEIDDTKIDIPAEVKTHFRNIRKIETLCSQVNISVFDKVFADRNQYIDEAKRFISSFKGERCIVFLDPDTGLEPERPSLNHVLDSEVKTLWNALESLDVLVLYQHQTNRRGEPWENAKRMQFAKAIDVPEGNVKIGRGPQLTHDVALLYVQRS